jgi:hypothetical protein
MNIVTEKVRNVPSILIYAKVLTEKGERRGKMLSKRASSMLVFLMLVGFSQICPIVLAGTGSLRINPAMPTTTKSPAAFETWVQGKGNASDPHVLLVMTNSSYYGLTADVKVEWTGGSLTVPKAAWSSDTDNGKKVPPDTAPGAWYTVASLRSHLGTTQRIWWAFQPFLTGQNITQTHVSFTVTLPSNDPRMLVYVLGKDAIPGLYDISVPDSIPGFVVFEPGPVFAMLALFSAFMVYAVKHNKT